MTIRERLFECFDEPRSIDSRKVSELVNEVKNDYGVTLTNENWQRVSRLIKLKERKIISPTDKVIEAHFDKYKKRYFKDAVVK